MEAWNSLNLQKVINIKNKRLTLLKARIKEYGIQQVLTAIESINQSPCLRGQSKTNWIITFDWFIKPSNFVKVLEGNYIDRDNNNTLNKPKDEYSLDMGEIRKNLVLLIKYERLALETIELLK